MSTTSFASATRPQGTADREPEGGSLAAQRLGRDRAWIPVALLAFAAATNRWTAGIGVSDGDVREYERIAAAAPSWPQPKMGSAYAQRFPIHYLIGLISDATGLGLHALYRVTWALTVLAIVVVVHRILVTLGVGRLAYGAAMAVFVLNPYTLRGYVLFPGADQDLLFVLGLALVLLGLLRVRVALLLTGIAVAVLGRQSGLLLAPAALAWVALGSGWRERTVRWRALVGGGALALTAAVYLALLAAVAGWTYSFAPTIPGDTVLPGLGSPPTVSRMATHTLRVIVPLTIPLAVLAAALLRARARAPGPRAEPGSRPASRRGLELATEAWLAMLLTVAVVIQPLVISPTFPGFLHNEQRLSGLGLLPLTVPLALALDRLVVRAQGRKAHGLVAAGLLAVAAGSLHHVYTYFGPSSQSQFVVVHLTAAAVLGALVGFGARARRPGAVPGAG